MNKERPTATLLTSLGSDAVDVIEGLPFEEEVRRKDPDVILEKLEKYSIGEINESFERHTFNKRDKEPYEPRDRITLGIRDNAAKKKLLQTQELTLKHRVDIVPSSEVATQQLLNRSVLRRRLDKCVENLQAMIEK